MDVILIPGFWLDASSWSEVSPALVEAGHRLHPLTLPGLSSIDEDRSGISFRDHVDAVVAEIDALPGEVVLVGHSRGGAIAGAAADARVERVAHVVYVDSFLLGDGSAINPDATGENGFPLPDWSEFGDEELVDMTDEIRAELRDLQTRAQRFLGVQAFHDHAPQRLGIGVHRCRGSQHARRQLRARLTQAVRPYQTPVGLDFPGVSLLAAGRRRP
jgi:pimeloyl-ACP methyl ester carboxylesterase